MDTAAASEKARFLALAEAMALPGFGGAKGLTGAARAFLDAVFVDASRDTGDGLAARDAIALAHDLFVWTQGFGGAVEGQRVRPALGEAGRSLGFDALEIVGPDAPFLVDSTLGELAEQGLAARALVHPIVGEAGAARSYIQILLKPLSENARARLLEGVQATLKDVRCIVADFAPLKGAMIARAEALEEIAAGPLAGEVAEGALLLRWLAGDRFTFLGARDYLYPRDTGGALAPVEPEIVAGSGLGLLRDPAAYVLRTSNEPMLLKGRWREMLNAPSPILLGKSTLRSRVHRRAVADYVGVKRYDEERRLIGETRFVGLLTTEAFTDPTRDIPILRKKVAWVVAQAGFHAGGHSEKALRHIIETYPREELWQIEPAELLAHALEIAHLHDRPRARLFIRRDPFNRFVSALAFLPKDRFNTQARIAIGQGVAQAYGGHVESFQPMLGEGPLARIHFIVSDIDRAREEPSIDALERLVVEVATTWDDRFEAALEAQAGHESARLRARFSGAFGAGYRERNDAAAALADVADIEAVLAGDYARARVRFASGEPAGGLRWKVFARGEGLTLSQLVPIFENLGLSVEAEASDDIVVDGGAGHVRVHEVTAHAIAGSIQPEHCALLEAAFLAVARGQTENDPFNRLTLAAGASWREAALIRALARFRQQTGLDPSPAVQHGALTAYPEIARALLALFRVRFDPEEGVDLAARAEKVRACEAEIAAGLERVAALDDDRALRRIAALASSIVRTNYYQRDAEGGFKTVLSFKIASQMLVDLPEPKPMFEIWVSSVSVEGVHLRMGKVARGGLRWSDRRDDFRAEVLDLVKAQQVKNAIITPVGAKGGFFPKLLPPRDAPGFLAAGVAAYRSFLCGLLDLTDNIVEGRVHSPADTVRWDEDDPYLVVAADKGTASFSDIANDVAASYGFWLGDAFASGGANGYEHKGMAITARGAWEAVKRHFRERGKDIQTEAFDVIGVGDMSGDVFGNGMLLSRKIRLLAAFDHRHIFIDPAPNDLDAAFGERARLFALPRSSWDDYDRALISPGGGVFPRAAKFVEITPEIAQLTGLTAPRATPSELISALLTAPCELLWFGGIGSFVKARGEAHASLADKANDAHRVDAEDVRAIAIGEGANLGVSQAGRIAFARQPRTPGGGRINTDAVDNSAGVDTSDHEVNIKILLADAIAAGALRLENRDPLFAGMANNVAAHVLRHNYMQTLALSLCERTAAADLESHARLVARLEANGKLSRKVETFPDIEGFRALAGAGLGLTRPELAKIIAYAKIDLFGALVAAEAPDDEAMRARLHAYFPPQCAPFAAQMQTHRLRREIIATDLADHLVNLCGPSFVDRAAELAHATPDGLARGFEAVQRLLGVNRSLEAVHALDNRAPAAAQFLLYEAIAALTRHLTLWLGARFFSRARPIADAVAAFAEPIAGLKAALASVLNATLRREVETQIVSFIAAGAPEPLARDIALMRCMTPAFDIAELARKRALTPAQAGALYFAVGEILGLDRLRAEAQRLSLDAHWDRLALRRSIDQISTSQCILAAATGVCADDPDAALGGVIAWSERLEPACQARVAEIAALSQGGWSFAKVILASAEVNALARQNDFTKAS